MHPNFVSNFMDYPPNMIVYWDDMVEVALFFFLLNILLKIWFLRYSSHISSAHWPHVATDHCVQKYRTFLLWQKILSGSPELFCCPLWALPWGFHVFTQLFLGQVPSQFQLLFLEWPTVLFSEVLLFLGPLIASLIPSAASHTNADTLWVPW